MKRSAGQNLGVVALLGVDPGSQPEISRIVHDAGFTPRSVATPKALEADLKSAPAAALILDIDSVPLNNRAIRELAAEAPSMPILCLSSARFHPELQESFRRHIYACLAKPLDPDELRYCLKSIQRDEPDRRFGEEASLKGVAPLETEEKWKNRHP